MATQNLVSASISPETKADVLEKIASVRASLSFLSSLKGRDIKMLVNPGNNYLPFLDKSYAAVTEHPEIMSAVFDREEFERDYRLSKDLALIAGQINELAESVSNTLTAVNSDTMQECLEIYASVKMNTNRIPGLTVIAAELAEFFKRKGRRNEKQL